MIRRSIRVRFALAMGLLVGSVVLGVTLAGGFLSFEVFEVLEEAHVGADLAEEEAALAAVLNVSGLDALGGLGPEQAAVVVDGAGDVVAAVPGRWRRYRGRRDGPSLELSQRDPSAEDRLHLVGGRELDGTLAGLRLYLFSHTGPETRIQRELRPALRGAWVTAAGIGFLLGAVGAWLLAVRLTGPIREVTAAARRLEAGERGVEVPPRGRDELAELATAFNRLATSLAELEDARRRLVSETAHELRTPLTRLRCQIEGVVDGLMTPDGEWVAATAADLGDLQQLIEDLQELALAESGQLPLEIETLSVGEEMRRLSRSFASERLELDGPEALSARADRTRLRQIVGNLVENALAFSPAREPIRIGWRQARRDRVEVSVLDRGPGLDPREQERVFERFYRADASRSRESGGSGLGLAIVRRLTEAQGGEVGVDSEPGRGARFWIQLPCAEAPLGNGVEGSEGPVRDTRRRSYPSPPGLARRAGCDSVPARR